jgi:hypothetical protein
LIATRKVYCLARLARQFSAFNVSRGCDTLALAYIVTRRSGENSETVAA